MARRVHEYLKLNQRSEPLRLLEICVKSVLRPPEVDNDQEARRASARTIIENLLEGRFDVRIQWLDQIENHRIRTGNRKGSCWTPRRLPEEKFYRLRSARNRLLLLEVLDGLGLSLDEFNRASTFKDRPLQFTEAAEREIIERLGSTEREAEAEKRRATRANAKAIDGRAKREAAVDSSRLKILRDRIRAEERAKRAQREAAKQFDENECLRDQLRLAVEQHNADSAELKSLRGELATLTRDRLRARAESARLRSQTRQPSVTG